MTTRVGVVLSGCGVRDGSEIHEATSILIALDRRGATAICLAPSGPQANVVDHLTGKLGGPSRDILVESARIARGKVGNLAQISADELDALIFPGGFGAVKNLSTFATQGANCKVLPELTRLVTDMHRAGKPIGLACIAPVLAAKILGSAGLKPRLTIGTDPDTAAAINAMGGLHEDAAPTGIVMDMDNHLVSTPCYMNDVGPWVVYQGVEKMVEQVLAMAKLH